ncbi:type II toxin-antitoxin system RelE/ParE family toxin [Flavobacterium sp. CS20]|uniref:type II toxin-antitoxin system RelE/ParE family toxin n=1 Tax=Flavobacterium sp. CS20 TaxID=2775246 RepID=UPI001B39D519|nr:type II toxin-antitoxin system RelE/ParE family toxin [Flavobacterium sp. CS20]QTY26807.1 type II toxin-antitoxin system RelE/ParE family toxin [Flavobacterium sp. CS20]
MYKAIILPLAKLDIAEATSWYNSKQKDLGKRFIKEVRTKVLFIRENPKASAVRYDDTRCTVLDVFPFMIHYTIDEPNKTIIVVAVLHTSLSPER